MTARVFTASYDGRCAACDGPIFEGDDLIYEDGEAIHAECADTDLPEPFGGSS